MSRGASHDYRFERALAMAADIANQRASELLAALGPNHQLTRLARSIAADIQNLSPHQPEGYRRKIERGEGWPLI